MGMMEKEIDSMARNFREEGKRWLQTMRCDLMEGMTVEMAQEKRAWESRLKQAEQQQKAFQDKLSTMEQDKAY